MLVIDLGWSSSLKQGKKYSDNLINPIYKKARCFWPKFLAPIPAQLKHSRFGLLFWDGS